MNFPKLQRGQYAVLKATTRPALFLGLGPHIDMASGSWKIFNTLAAAHDYALTEVTTQTSVECGIYDARECHVHTVRI